MRWGVGKELNVGKEKKKKKKKKETWRGGEAYNSIVHVI